MDNPPAARVEAVRDSYFGVVIEDPYRWMEDHKGAEAQSWLRSQAQHAAQVLGALPADSSASAAVSSGAQPQSPPA